MAAVTSDIHYGFDGLPIIIGSTVWCVDDIYGYTDSLIVDDIRDGVVIASSPDGFINVVVEAKPLSHKPLLRNHGFC